jgi:DNA helicase HerA-like ATPase
MEARNIEAPGPESDSDGAAVRALPESVLGSLDEQVDEAGGEWREPPEFEGSIGRTMFDTPASADGTVTVLLPKENVGALPSQSLVRIKSFADARSYLGVVVKGPFAEPDGLRADAPIVVTATVRGGIFMPKYHGRVQVELIGEELEDGGVVPPRRRPLPNSPVFALPSVQVADVLRTGGDIRLGLADSQEDIEVAVPSTAKSVFPRHTGILGTTGGGKSTTVSGLLAQLQHAGVASIILDTEGEYTAIHEATDDPHMQRALSRREMTPAGVNDTYVYFLVGREVANPEHPKLNAFSLQFAALSPYAVIEILDLTDAQQERFLKAYDVAKIFLERLKIFPANEAEREDVIELDELDAGYPRMTLAHVYDIVRQVTSVMGKEEDPYLETADFYKNREQLKELIAHASLPGNQISWRALLGRLGRVKRLGIFDNPKAPPINYAEVTQPGRVFIIDLSDTDSPQVNNLVIAQILRGVQRQQDENYQQAVKAKRQPTPVLVFIEEAHEFLSAQRIKDMPVLFQQVARIARRGRKRWLGLIFITQLPQHLPDEVLGLINNWVLHKINDSNVVNRLRRSIGGIDAALWERLPNLAPGQAIVSFTSLARPLMVAIDPTPCKLQMVE